MPAAIVAHIHDETVTIVIPEKMAMELGKAPCHHIGDVDVTRPPAGSIADIIAVALDPVAVAGLLLVSKGPHADLPHAVSSFDGQVNFGSSLMHERMMRRHRSAQPLPIHRGNHIPSFKPNARCPKRTGLICLPGIAAQKTADAIAGGGTVPDDIGAQKADGIDGFLAVIAPEVVSMRRAELTLHFPNEIGKFRAAVDASHERCIAQEHRLPVYFRHIRPPEMVALQPP